MQRNKLIKDTSAIPVLTNLNADQETILPGFFRQDSDPLYSCYHKPTCYIDQPQSVLICNSVGHEYERCHRPLRQLAIQLARSGHHVMRFDYFGTGDSAGDYTQATISRWRADVTDAISECKRQAGCENVCLVGLRMGATLAAQIAANRKDIKALVLYEPVVDGNTLLAEWKTEQLESGYAQAGSNHQEILGYLLTSAFRAELSHELFLPTPCPELRRILILSHNPEDKKIGELAANFKNHGAKVSVKLAEVKPVWQRQSTDAVVPYKLLRLIASWLQEQQT